MKPTHARKGLNPLLPHGRLTPVSAAICVMLLPHVSNAFAVTTPLSDAPATSAASAQTPAQLQLADNMLAFDKSLLWGDQSRAVDLKRFEDANAVLPGTYRADVYVNGQSVGPDEITFRETKPGGNGEPCITRDMLNRIGVAGDKMIGIGTNIAPQSCLDLARVVPGATFSFNSGEQRADFSIPQASMLRVARGYVPPDRWDSGAPVGYLNYRASSYQTNAQGLNGRQDYASVDAGANLNGWMFRHQSTYARQPDGTSHWQNLNTYVQHDIPAWESRVRFGETYTSGQWFDSMPIRGVSLANDARMRPDSQTGYAPTIRGTAETNARVSVRQNGTLIYETTVSPGAFEINDLYPTGYGGNLDVTITEADGRVKQLSVPYAAVPQALREGATNYAVDVGTVRDNAIPGNPYLAQFTVQRGLTNFITGYGGAALSKDYYAFIGGAAVNTQVGAFSVDLTHAHTHLVDGDFQGQSARVGYSKTFSETGTSFSMAAYRYSTSGYYGVREAMTAIGNGSPAGLVAHERSRGQLTVNQTLGRWGSVFLTGSVQDYWNQSGRNIQYQAGYTGTRAGVTYSVSLMRVQDLQGRFNNQIFASLSMPLGKSLTAPVLSSSVTSGNGTTTAQASVSGYFDEGRSLNYMVNGNYSNGGGNSSGGGSLQYNLPYTVLNGGASVGNGYSQVSAGIAGSVVAHPGGVTFGQTLGETFGIVEAPNAAGAEVTNAPGVKIDRFGYAVVPYLTPYRANVVSLDPKGLPVDVELTATSQEVVPTAGAGVLVKFRTQSGRAVLISAKTHDGKPVPFGATVFDTNGHSVGVVGQGGQILARGVEDTGSLTVKWGDDEAQACHIDYKLPKVDKSVKQKDYDRLTANCLVGPATVAPASVAWVSEKR